MSHTNKIRRESKRLKSDKREFIKDIFEESQKESNNNNLNDFSIFNIKNIELMHKSKKEKNELEERNKNNENKNNQTKTNNYNYNYKCLISPHECQSVPLIIINSNRNTVCTQCPSNGYSNEITNPHEPDEMIEIPINEYLKKISELCIQIRCSKCSKKYDPALIQKNNNKTKLSDNEEDEEEEDEEEEEDDNNSFFLCYSCNKYFCNKCKEEHIKYNNKNDINLSEKHYIINVNDISYHCFFHDTRYFAYCNNCKQNICIKCFNEKKHKSHDITFFKNIMINSIEVSEIKNKINIEKKNLDYIETLFMENLEKLKTNFCNLLESKREISKLKEILINQYEKKNYNYQMIMTCLKMELIWQKLKEMKN